MQSVVQPHRRQDYLHLLALGVVQNTQHRLCFVFCVPLLSRDGSWGRRRTRSDCRSGFRSVVHTKKIGCVTDEKRAQERNLNPVQFHTSAHCVLSAPVPNSSRFSSFFSLPAGAGNEADERMNYNSEPVSHKTTTMGWRWAARWHWGKVWWQCFMAAILYLNNTESQFEIWNRRRLEPSIRKWFSGCSEIHFLLICLLRLNLD